MRAREAGRVVLKVRRVVDADAAVDGEEAGLRRVGMRRANIVAVGVCGDGIGRICWRA